MANYPKQLSEQEYSALPYEQKIEYKQSWQFESFGGPFLSILTQAKNLKEFTAKFPKTEVTRCYFLNVYHAVENKIYLADSHILTVHDMHLISPILQFLKSQQS